MPENNYFNYTDAHIGFLHYLLSFAMEQYKDEDPLLSDCAKELIRYILGMDETESVVVTEVEPKYVIVNYDKNIWFGSMLYPYLNGREEDNCYFVCYNPNADFSMEKSEQQHVICLSMKKLKDICDKYRSKNQIYMQYVQYLDGQVRMLQTTLQTPMVQWNKDDYRRFSLHLIEDSVVDMTRGMYSGEYNFFTANGYRHTYSIHWYYISDKELNNMGMAEHIAEMYLYTYLNTINIEFRVKPKPNSKRKKQNEYVQALRRYADYIGLLPITFDLSDYKEKFQFAQSIMDRLVKEFRL